MRYANMIVNGLIGLVFFVFGLNGFLNFMPMPPLTGDVATFSGVMLSTGYMKVIKVLEVVLGAMILFGFQRPLAYILLAPIVVGILLFELLVAKQPGIGILLTALLAWLIYQNRSRYLSILN